MASVIDLAAQRGHPGGLRRFVLRRWSLYARVVVVNVMVLLAGLVLLLWTPITVSAPVSGPQAIVLVGALLVLAIVNAALLRVTLWGLPALARRMETLDVLRPHERLSEAGGAEARALIRGFNTMHERLTDERRSSTRRNVTAIEGERRRISRELHDEIGQRLTGMLLQLGRIHDEAPDTVRPRVAAVQDDTRAVMDEVGALAWREMPAVLDDFGLIDALRALAACLGGPGPARIETVLPHRSPPMTGETKLAAYRIAQEALTNAARHSGARVITLRMQEGPAEIRLQVVDDGRGLPAAASEGPGLRGMRERALLIGARLDIVENSPHGLRVELTVPAADSAG